MKNICKKAKEAKKAQGPSEVNKGYWRMAKKFIVHARCLFIFFAAAHFKCPIKFCLQKCGHTQLYQNKNGLRFIYTSDFRGQFCTSLAHLYEQNFCAFLKKHALNV